MQTYASSGERTSKPRVRTWLQSGTGMLQQQCRRPIAAHRNNLRPVSRREPELCPATSVMRRLCLAGIVFILGAVLPTLAAATDVQSVKDLVRKPFEARIVTVVDGDTVEGLRDGE